MLIGIAAALLACFSYGTASVLQSYSAKKSAAAPEHAATVNDDGGPTLRSTVTAMLAPAFVLGMALDGLGFLGSLVSARLIPLFLSQTVMSANLVVTAVLSTLVLRVRLHTRDWTAIAVVLAALCILGFTAGKLGKPDRHIGLHWGVLVVSAVVLAIGIALVGLLGRRAAVAAGLFAGVLYGAMAVAVRIVHGLDPLKLDVLLADPASWAIVVAGGGGFYLFTVALQVGAVNGVAAALVVGETVVPGVIGVALLGDSAKPGYGWLVVLAFAAAVIGAVAVAVFGAAESDFDGGPGGKRLMIHRYVVIGAGAIGGTIGGVLARADVPVILVARGRHGEVLSHQGLTMRTPDGEVQVPVRVVSGADQLELSDHDVLVFAAKTQQLDAALRDWVDRPVRLSSGEISTAAQALPVLTALNGVTAEELALRYFRRVYGVCVWLPALHLEPGEVIVRSWPMVGQLHIARWPATVATAEDSALLGRIAQSWSGAGIRVNMPADVAPWKYNKLLTNLGNIVGALLGDDGAVGSIAKSARSEGQEVLRCAGIDAISVEASDAARADGPHPRHVPGLAAGATNSTWQSLHRRTGDGETDYLNGEIVRMAHRCGIAAPVNSVLSALARSSVREQTGPGRYCAADLIDLIEASRRAGEPSARSE